MKKVFIGLDFFNRKVFWNLNSHNSVFVGGLSGSGKSFLINWIINCFLSWNYRVIIISEKARVDFKDSRTTRINMIEESNRIDPLIDEITALMISIKRRVENSPLSFLQTSAENEKILIVIDELWEVNRLEKNLKIKFEHFCESLIRQARYMNTIQIVFASQISRVSETSIPIRQCSLIISGKTDTKELSESLFSSDLAYSSDFLKRGLLLFWDRETKPKFIKIVKEPKKFSIYFVWILKFLMKT